MIYSSYLIPFYLHLNRLGSRNKQIIFLMDATNNFKLSVFSYLQQLVKSKATLDMVAECAIKSRC